jgi:hypothetical protein
MAGRATVEALSVGISLAQPNLPKFEIINRHQSRRTHCASDAQQSCPTGLRESRVGGLVRILAAQRAGMAAQAAARTH